MACKGCGSSSICACSIVAGQGITIEGTGTPTNPYIVTASILDLTGVLRVRDTETVDLTLIGSGTTSDPFEIRANSSLKLTQLQDVADPSGGPAVGESLVWVGVGLEGHWEYGTLPPAPAGAVNAADGIDGIGSVGDPLVLAAAAVWGAGELADLGGDSTIGLPVYVDSSGKVRAKPVATSVAWSAVSGKPTTFPPNAHSHVAANITDQVNLDVGKINGRRITVTATSTTPPPVASPLDIWLFPEGS